MILVALAVIAAIGPSLVRDPVTQNIPDRLTPPNGTYWFGTDDLGRDIFARVVSGAPISLVSGLASVAIGLALGTLIGTIAGYVEGRTGLALMAGDGPAAGAAGDPAGDHGGGAGGGRLDGGDGCRGAGRTAGLCPALAGLDPGREAAGDGRRGTGHGRHRPRIITRHILPNILTPLIVQSTIGVGNAILLVSALGFLGLGAQPPTPEWGRMLSDAQRYVTDAPYIGDLPGAGHLADGAGVQPHRRRLARRARSDVWPLRRGVPKLPNHNQPVSGMDLVHSPDANGCSPGRFRMPLKIEMSPESVRPVVVCDGCGEPIADARDGNYQWQAPVDPGLSRKFVFFTHKWCAHTFEQARGGSGAWYAMELTELLPHVARALNIDWDEATRYAGLSTEF